MHDYQHPDYIADLDYDYKRDQFRDNDFWSECDEHDPEPVPYTCACGWASRHTHTGPFVVGSRNADGSPKHRG